MSWLRLDDEFAENPKIAPLSDRAFRFHVAALCVCAAKLTDGKMSRKAVRVLAATLEVDAKRRTVELEQAGLWIAGEDGWQINDYLDYNPSAEEVRAKREARAEAGRRGGIASGEARANAQANGEANASAPAQANHEPPSPPIPKDQEHSQPLTYSGDDPNEQTDYNHALERIVEACGSTTDARQKLAADVLEHHPPEARLVEIHWAITRNGTNDRLGKARSMIRRTSAGLATDH